MNLQQVAEDTLSLFSSVAALARSALGRDREVAVGAVVGVNTFNNPNILGARVRDEASQYKDMEVLAREPAIARVVVSEADGMSAPFSFVGRPLVMHVTDL
jgi:hypothetical protein